jgi:ParB/RepB/Spo0J family partition protein
MEASEQLKHVELSLIEISGANPRKDVKGESFKELKASIAELGILEPLIVRPKGKGYELVAGERRLTAAKELKLKTVPVVIRDLDDHMARVVMLVENLQRENLKPLEEAAALEELLIPYGTPIGTPHMTQEELAKKLKKSQPWIANRLRLNKAPADLKKYLEKEQISAQHVMVVLPFVEWPIYEKVLKEEIAIKVDENDRIPGSHFTVEDMRTIIEDVITRDEKGEHCFHSDRLPWKMEKYKPYLDLEACKTCKVPINFKDFTGSDQDRRRVCLKIDCFRPKFKAAAKAYREAEAKKQEKLEKAESVPMTKLAYGSYEVLDYAKFPKDQCKECPSKKVSKEAISSIESGSNKKRMICLKLSCFREKRKAWDELQNAYGDIVQETVLKEFKKYIASRPAGLKKPELLFLCEVLLRYDRARLKKGKLEKFSEKELETEILNCVLLDRLDELYNAEDLVEEIKSLPFKVEFPEMPKLEPETDEEEPIEVTEDMDPALKEAIEEKEGKKKVQEKRKKKGTA